MYGHCYSQSRIVIEFTKTDGIQVQRSYNVHTIGKRSTRSPLLISTELFSSPGAILDPDTHASCGTPEHTPSVVANDYFPRVPLKHICPFLTSMFLHTFNVISEEQ